MIARIIEFSVRNRWLVILAWTGIAVWGLYAVLHTPVDAIPDLSENQVIVFTDWMGRSPQDIEDQVTYPLSVKLQGMQGVKSVRASSEFNFSMINVIFDEKMDFYTARQRVQERLALAAAELSAAGVNAVPYMAPDATALGQIFWYTVEGEGRSLDELRAVQDWTVRYQLNSVPGVAEVASVGGFVREYQVDVDPHRLRAYDLPLGQLYSAIAASNMSVGGKVVVEGNSEYVVRGVGWLRGLGDLENVVVTSRSGVPIRLKDVATVQLGPEFRRSALEKNGREVVGGVVMMRYGENPLAVTRLIKEKIRDLQAGLPQGVRVVPFYDRTRLIESAIHTVTGTLREEIIIASIAILLILTHFRSAFVVCITLPMAVLISFLLMYYLKIPSNIMSLSGIAISIGILVDAAVVMVENATHELHQAFGKEKVGGDTTEFVVRGCRLVGRPIFFSVLIMLISFLPVFSFGGQEGKLSHPLAFTKSFAMIGVALVAITLVPAMIPLLVRGRLRGEEENLIVRSFINIYKPLLSWMVDRPGVVWWLMGVILCLGAGMIRSGAAAGIAVAMGVVFVVLGVRRSGWTMWIIAAAMVFTFAVVGLRGQGATFALPSGAVGAIVPWLVAAAVGGLVILAMVLGHWRTAAVATLLTVAFLADTRFRKLGAEFMPALDEGSIMDMPTSAPRIAMAQAVDDVMVRNRIIRTLPEVEMVVGKVGRAETSTDPSPVDMVETVIAMRAHELWPKRKIEFADALRQGAAVAEAMHRQGWLKPQDLRPDEWERVARAVQDSDFLKYHPQYMRASEMLNTAVSVAVEQFDRAMRQIARQRQSEYEPILAQELGEGIVDDVVGHIRGKSSLLRDPSADERRRLIDAIRPSLLLLVEVPRQEEVDALLVKLRTRLVDWGIAAKRDDLLLDKGGALRNGLRSLRSAVGAPMPDFAERLLAQVESRRDVLWQKRTRELNWELLDRAPAIANGLLIDNILRTATGTPLAAATPPEEKIREIRSTLDAPFADGLLLWRKTKDDVLRELDSELQMPGWGNAWTQPIINRVNMLATGVRTQIGVKVFGPTAGNEQALDDVQRVSNQIAARLKKLDGAVDVVADQAVGKRYLEITIDRENAGRYGVNMAEISEAVETALGGARVSQTVEGRQRFPVRLRYARDQWQDIDSIGNVLVTARTTAAELLSINGASGSGFGVQAPGGEGSGPGVQGSGMEGMGKGPKRESMPSDRPNAPAPPASPIHSVQPAGSTVLIPLRMVADIRVVEGPSMIKSENGRLRNYVTLNVRGRDIVGFVDEARAAIKDIESSLAGTGMSIEWSGEFEHEIRLRQTMIVVFPMVVAVIVLLLHLTFGSILDTLLVLLAVLGALCGSVMFQSLFGFNFSVVVWIGYIAAFGMATQTGVIMIVYLRDALDRRGGLQGIGSLEALRQAVIEGAVHRLRPKLLTEGVAIIGLVPMLWATGTGAEIMRPMAAPVLGGLLISDEVVDLMIPVLFYWIRRRKWLKLHSQAAAKPVPPPAAQPVPV